MAGMIRTLLGLIMPLRSHPSENCRDDTPLYFKRGTIKAFASENIQEKNDLLFCKAHVVCVHQFLVYLLSNVFWGHFSPRFLSSRSRVFPLHSRFLRVFLFYLSELIEKAYFQGWLLILLLIFHLKKSVFSMSFQLQLEVQFSPCQILIFWQFLGFCPSVQHQ